MKKSTILRITRWTILISILVLTTVMGRLHQLIKLYPSIDAFCPFGGLESLWALFRYQTLLRKIAWSSVILLITSVGTTLIFRRSFCGNICPLGFLQEIFGFAGKGLFKKRYNLPDKVDKVLRFVKYVVLVVFLALSWKTLTLAIHPYDPWVAFHHIGSDELFTKNLIGTIVLFSSLGLGIFIDRPFCRYLCPMGGFLAIVSKLGITRIKRNSSTCIDCGVCDKVCPSALKISTSHSIVTGECISCSECVNSCPVENTLFYETPGTRAKKISSALLLLGTVAIFAALIGTTTFSKHFVWKADTGLERHVERLLYGPEKIGSDNQMIHIVQIYKIHPLFLKDRFSLETDEDFYKTFEEMNIDIEDVKELIYAVYEQAGQDPNKLLGGGCGGEEH